ncbi:zinc ribbon domain-containing protein, partial [Ellagibacter isourolithinifaciens]|uniref:zinc ribbon domain-containing protein n=1 Tax=Ellagibacter isourolithinifaciens TaxID=2137581 RepID=UPI003A8F7715
MGGGVGGAFADVARNLSVSGPSRTCPSCGDVVPPGQKFCGNCGWDMAKPAPGAAAEGAGFCTECGAPLAASMKFCGQCGHAVASDGVPGTENSEEAGSDGR